MHLARALPVVGALIATAVVGEARAQRVATGGAVVWGGAHAAELLAAARPGAMIAAIVEVPTSLDEIALRAFGLRPIAPGIATLVGDADTIAGFARAHTDWSMEVAPPLRSKLDLAVKYVEADPPSLPTALDGARVYIGIVDTGLDVFHADFRDSTGKTRVAWYLDLSLPPRPDKALDVKYGGRVFDRAAMDAIVAAGPGPAKDTPTDGYGHGTHVAGIAAGNGGAMKRLVGMAPAADLVIVRASRQPGGAIFEADAILGTRFVFDMADADDRPAVVNLSLGSHFGPHDGTSTFERGLTSQVGGPGRAIVVAVSNEGALPIHTSLRVSRGATFKVPIRLAGVDGRGAGYGPAGVYAWLNWRDGGDVRVALEGPGGNTWIESTARGQTHPASPAPGVQANISNDVHVDEKTIPRDTHGALVTWRSNGSLPVGEYALLLTGDGAVEAWVEGSDDASDGPGQPLFGRGATSEGSVAIPASAPGLLSVGCVYHRTSYTSSESPSPKTYAINGAVLGLRCPFSSAGPSALGALRPDLVAPGYYVASSLARTARDAIPYGLFSTKALVDSDHAVLSGTSMSSPFVTGAIALLFQKDRTLTQEDARAVLMAGARPLADDAETSGVLDYAKGAGILNVAGAVAALDRRASATHAVSLQMRLGASWIANDGRLPLWALVVARDGAGRPADVDGEVQLDLQGAVVASPVEHPAVGLYRFALAGSPGGPPRAHVRFASAGLAVERDIPVGADRWDARDGLRASGGCGVGGVGVPPGHAWAVGALAMLIARGRRRSRTRGRDREGRPGSTT